MTRDEVKDLHKQIFMFYPRFESRPELVNAWHDRLKDMPYETALANLNRYIAEDENGRVPTIAKIMRVSVSGTVDEWKAYRENMVLSYYDKDTYIDQNGYLWAYPQAE